MVDMNEENGKYCIHLVGFPRLSPRSDSKSNMLSLVDAIKALVPEAVVHEYNILDAEEGDYLRDHDTEGEDEEGKRQTIIEEASHRAWKVRDTEIAESIDEDVEQVSGPKTFEHQNEEGCAQTLRHERFAEFSASWFEAKTTYLLKSIQKTECAHASADGGKCILAGYGLGGILIKQVVNIANTSAEYYDVWLHISRLVFFATPHCSDAEMTWDEVLFNLIKSTDRQTQAQSTIFLGHLADIVSRLSVDFYRFAAKYTITNFVRTEPDGRDEPLMSSLCHLDKGFKRSVLLEGKSLKGMMLLEQNGLPTLDILRKEFGPWVLFEQADDSLQGGLTTLLLEALQAVSPSRRLLYQIRSLNIQGSLGRLNSSIIAHVKANIPPPGATGYSIQVTGPPGCGKSAAMRFISQQRCRESPLILLELMRNDNNTSGGLYSIYITLIHQLLSQKQSGFWSLRAMLAQRLSQNVWTPTSSLVLLTEMLLRCQSLEFLIVIYDVEEWPRDIQSWWSNSLVPLLHSCGIRFNILTSSRQILECFGSLTLCNIDVEKEYDRLKHAFVTQTTHNLADRAYGKRNIRKFVAGTLKPRIMSKALSFQGSFISIRAYIASLLSSFPLNNEEAIQNAMALSPRTETEFYEAESLALPQKFPSTLFWITAAISWLLSAARPLRVSELATAAAVSMDDRDLNDVKYKISMDMEYDLKRHISAFVVIESGYVTIASAAAREVLSRADIRKRLSLQGDYDLSLLCLHYLKLVLNDISKERWTEYCARPFRRDSSPWLNDPEYRFFDYACRFWPTHFLRVENPNEELRKTTSQFLLDSELGIRWLEFYFILNGRAAGSMENVRQVFGSTETMKTLDGCEPMNCEAKSIHAACSRLEAAAMARYNGLQSVIPFILQGHLSEVETLSIIVRRGWFQGLVAFPMPDSAYILEAAIANDMAAVVDEMFRKNPAEVTSLLPLHTAALMGSHETANLLLKILQDPFQLDGNGATPLHLAAAGGSHEMIQLIASHADISEDMPGSILDVQNSKSETSLIMAAQMGNMQAVESFIQLGADVDLADQQKRTALHYAIMNCATVPHQLITEKVATCIDNSGSTPLHLAIMFKNQKVAIALLEMFQSSGQTETALTSQNNDGQTPLHLAAKYGQTELVKRFLENSGQPALEDREGKWALDLAAIGGHLDTVLELIEGSPKDAALSSRALLVACKAGQLLVVEHLLKDDMADPNGDQDVPIAPLSIAAAVGHYSIVNALLRYRANPNIRNDQRETPLHWAAKNGRHMVVQTLLDNGAKEDARNIKRETPLHQATISGATEVMSILIQAGADIQASSRDKRTPLHLAVDSLGAIQVLLTNGANPDLGDIVGQTPLHIAANKGHHEAVKLLLDHEADISIRDDKGATPLDLAVRNNDMDLVEILCKYLANTDTPDNLFHVAACIAVEVLAVEVLMFLLTTSPGAITQTDDEKRTLLHLAADNDDGSKVLASLLQCCATIDPLDDEDRSPLHYAARRGCRESMQLLIDSGAEIDKQDGKGKTPLHYAVESRKYEAVDILVSANAKVDQRTADGETPILIAVEIEEVEITKRLLDSDANLHIPTISGWTPLHVAATGSLEVTNLLVRHGADPNRTTPDGWAPLHIAACHGELNITKLLLENKANPDIVDSSGWTALHFACSEGEYQIAKALLNGGASASIKSQDLKTCLDCAAQKDQHRIIELLLDPSSPAGLNITWETHDVEHCYWEAIEYNSIRAVEFLIGMDSSLLNRESEDGSTGLEMCLLQNSGWDQAKGLAQCFLNLGADPFRRQRTSSPRTAFELAMFSSTELKSSFIQACIDKISTPLDPSTSELGFKELRIASELDDVTLWNKLAPLQENEDVLKSKDEDGWNIDCFVHQSNGKIKADVLEVLSLQMTIKPSGMIMPPMWISSSMTNNLPQIEANGLDILFPERTSPVALRADFPFRPRDIDLAYFEITIHGEVEESKSAEEDHMVTVAIGMCGEFSNMADAHAGWNLWSMGYHSDDGNIFEECSYDSAESVGKTFGHGNTVGCGINYSKGEYFFTIDGEIVASRRSNLIHRKLYPMVSHNLISCRITVNLGHRPYAWVDAVEQLVVKREAPRRLQERPTSTVFRSSFIELDA